MPTVTATNTLSLGFSQAFSYGVGQTLALSVPLVFRSLLNASGTLADQCDLVHSKTYTLAASTPQSIDLTSLLDPVGAAVNFARVRLIAIRCNAIVTGAVLTLGNSGANDWTGMVSVGGTTPIYSSTANNDGFTIRQMPGTPGAVVTPTSKILKLDPGSNAMTVDVLIAGCSA